MWPQSGSPIRLLKLGSQLIKLTADLFKQILTALELCYALLKSPLWLSPHSVWVNFVALSCHRVICFCELRLTLSVVAIASKIFVGLAVARPLFLLPFPTHVCATPLLLSHHVKNF